MIGLVMAILLCVLGKIYEIRAKNKLKTIEDISETSHIHNPLPQMWCWVLFNLFGQLVNIAKSFVFVIDTSLQCMYDRSVFVFLT